MRTIITLICCILCLETGLAVGSKLANPIEKPVVVIREVPVYKLPHAQKAKYYGAQVNMLAAALPERVLREGRK